MLYGPDYFAKRSDWRRSKMQDQERARLRERTVGGRILDVGCGDGLFLAGLDDRWEKWAVEPQAWALRAKMDLHLIPYEERWPEKLESESFDVIVFRGTIQHVDQPFYVLRECVRLLRTGGWLVFLATPNTGSLCYRLFQRLPALDPARNWLILSAGQLEDILGRLGEFQVELEFPYWGTPYARPLHDLVSFVLGLFGVRRDFAFPGNMMEAFCQKWEPTSIDAGRATSSRHSTEWPTGVRTVVNAGSHASASRR